MVTLYDTGYTEGAYSFIAEYSLKLDSVIYHVNEAKTGKRIHTGDETSNLTEVIKSVLGCAFFYANELAIKLMEKTRINEYELEEMIAESLIPTPEEMAESQIELRCNTNY